MKLSTLISVLAVPSGVVVVVVADPTHATCSIGISRLSATIIWSATLYNTPSSQVQVSNIIGSANGVVMAKGQSMVINATSPSPSPPSDESSSVSDGATHGPRTRPTGVTITNVDNAPVFDFDLPELTQEAYVRASGNTKVDLAFESSEGVTWDTSVCWPGNVVFSGGRESWTCDFACWGFLPPPLLGEETGGGSSGHGRGRGSSQDVSPSSGRARNQ